MESVSSSAAIPYVDNMETDAMSDSDWCDIASSRESEDTDSVISRDDREDADVDRLSRRSSISFTGTSDSAGNAMIERWEGFLDERDDECQIGECEAIPSSHDNVLLQPSQDAGTLRDDSVDEDNVKAALDQSMISTLSSSRSSSHSFGRASGRDLRLSFPDPILSNSASLCKAEDRNDLNRSYDHISRSDSELLGPFAGTNDAPLTLDDLGKVPTPEVIPQVVSSSPKLCGESDFNIILYGCSSPVKLSVVEALLSKAATAAGGLLSSPEIGIYIFKDGTRVDKISQVISITDRTISTGRDVSLVPSLESSSYTPDRPVNSLAIIYLPSSITRDCIQEHTYYLPILVPPTCIINSFSEEIERHAARHRWNTLHIPENKVLLLNHMEDGSRLPGIVDAQAIETMDANDMGCVAETLFSNSDARLTTKLAVLKHLGTRFNVLTVLTLLLSVLLTYTLRDVHHGFSSVDVPPRGGSLTVATDRQSVSILSASVPLGDGKPVKALIPSSVKDFALAILDTGCASDASTSSASVSAPLPARSATKQSVPMAQYDEGEGWSSLGYSSKRSELIIRPEVPVPSLGNAVGAKALSVISAPPSSISSSWKGKGKASDDDRQEVTALSIRVIGSLSEWFDVQTVLDVVRRDVKELVDALEELMQLIGGMVEQGRRSLQTFVARMDGSVNKAHSQHQVLVPEGKGVGDVIGERHLRAKERAIEIKEVGKQWVMSSVKRKAEHAREHAKAFADQVSGHDTVKRSCDRKKDVKELSRGILDYVF